MDELIQQVKDGDRDSANQLVRLYYDEIYVYVYKLTYNKEISLDLTQDIFMRVLKNINKYKSKKGSFKSWIYKIAHNYVINYFHSSDYKYLKVADDIPEYLSVDVNMDLSLIKNEDALVLKNALYSLETKYKEVIIMRYYQDLSIDEISSILETNDNTVKTRLRRGLLMLKECLVGGDNHD